MTTQIDFIVSHAQSHGLSDAGAVKLRRELQSIEAAAAPFPPLTVPLRRSWPSDEQSLERERKAEVDTAIMNESVDRS